MLPQTLTVNLVVTLLRIAPARTIHPKRWPHTPVDLVELTVADDTRAGLGVNLWLPRERSGEDDPVADANAAMNDVAARQTGFKARRLCPAESLLVAAARDLRLRDVVLFRNVALNAYRGQVYAQSLRRGVTKVELLYRAPDMMGSFGASGGGGSEVEEREPVWDVGELEACLDGVEEQARGQAAEVEQGHQQRPEQAERQGEPKSGAPAQGQGRGQGQASAALVLQFGRVLLKAAHVRRWTSEFVAVGLDARAPAVEQTRQTRRGREASLHGRAKENARVEKETCRKEKDNERTRKAAKREGSKRAEADDGAQAETAQRRSKRVRVLPPDTQ
jgi:hypothetical protein